MKRDLYASLLAWKREPIRKPLLVRGARQTGKTYLLKEFGNREFDHVFYFDFERQPILDSFFQRDLDAKRILNELSVFSARPIRPECDLIIFDEIQASPKALQSLKYFCDEVPQQPVAAAGSLLGVTLSRPGTFPVGKVAMLDLAPMTFFEFLDATGHEHYRDYLERLHDPNPLPPAFHEDLSHLLKQYYVVGGMPEVVGRFASSPQSPEIRELQQDIVNSFRLDFAKHAPTSDIPKLGLIWDSLPAQLARENKRFLFSAVREGARARSYEDALLWLEGAGLIHRAFCVNTAKTPLPAFANRQLYKVYALDVGLLGCMANLPGDAWTHGDLVFQEFRGAFVENFVAQHMAAAQKALFYWRPEKGTSEVDFLLQGEHGPLPLEVKAGINPQSKSLKVFREKFHPPLMVRTTALNLRRDGDILNVPLYALPWLLQRAPDFATFH